MWTFWKKYLVELVLDVEHKKQNRTYTYSKTQSGEIKLDKTGKLPGRGAYICDKSECLNLAIRSKKLEKTFETKIEESVYESLKIL